MKESLDDDLVIRNTVHKVTSGKCVETANTGSDCKLNYKRVINELYVINTLEYCHNFLYVHLI